ncbi:MAG: hypothetical protein JWL86_5418 [Rhizobium sp.]|nr:hypothetical protein [Rhizobium sp.]
MSTLQVEGTLLVLSSMGIPLYSARGLTQTLTPIAASVNQRRTINFVLDDLSQAQSRKYASKISCTDMASPAFDGVWPGQAVTVDCVVELSYRTIGGSPSRTVVSGSSRTVGSFTLYRPRLEMMLSAAPSISLDEWGGAVGWEADFEEI